MGDALLLLLSTHFDMAPTLLICPPVLLPIARPAAARPAK
jgi:TRAP-type C4-dicarboxylate transport system permease large subunit